MYRLMYSKKALKQLKKMDRSIALVITEWLKKNINGTDNPRVHGKGLVSDKSGLWRYRVGSYRILVKIDDNVLIVQAMEIGHRKEVYNFNKH